MRLFAATNDDIAIASCIDGELLGAPTVVKWRKSCEGWGHFFTWGREVWVMAIVTSASYKAANHVESLKGDLMIDFIRWGEPHSRVILPLFLGRLQKL